MFVHYMILNTGEYDAEEMRIENLADAAELFLEDIPESNTALPNMDETWKIVCACAETNEHILIEITKKVVISHKIL